MTQPHGSAARNFQKLFRALLFKTLARSGFLITGLTLGTPCAGKTPAAPFLQGRVSGRKGLAHKNCRLAVLSKVL